jgi:hypothetical protein
MRRGDGGTGSPLEQRGYLHCSGWGHGREQAGRLKEPLQPSHPSFHQHHHFASFHSTAEGW